MADEDGTERTILGAEFVGEPLLEAHRCILITHDSKRWQRLPIAPVNHYFDRVLFSWFPRLLDKALSTTQLRTLVPGDVITVALHLTRDMYRHHAEALSPGDAPAWVETMFGEIATSAGVRMDPSLEKYEFEPRPREWADRIGDLLGVADDGRFAAKLAFVHHSIVGGMEDVET